MVIAVTRDAGHNYRRGDVGPFVSVTTIVAKGKADPTAIKGWERRHAIEFMAKRYGLGGEQAPPALLGAIEAEVTKAALKQADTGTAVHAALEVHIKLGLASGAVTDLAAPAVRQQYEQFLTFERIRGVRWLASEVPLLCECHEIGGTVDALGMMDGKDDTVLIDFKTGRRTWLDHVLQLAGYWHLLEVNGHKPARAGILHLAEGEPYEFREIMPTAHDFEVLLARKLDYEWQQTREIDA